MFYKIKLLLLLLKRHYKSQDFHIDIVLLHLKRFPEERPWVSDAILMSGISGLSFQGFPFPISSFISLPSPVALSVFLLLLFVCVYLCVLPMAHFPDFQKSFFFIFLFFIFSRDQLFCVVLVEQL